MSGEAEKLKAVFFEAFEKDSPESRAAFLDAACAGAGALRARVETLLAAEGKAARFLRGTDDRGADSPLLERPGARVGHYRLHEEIGEGGFGIVFRAEQEEPVRRRVALKILKPGLDTRQVVARFEAERQALGLMDHPSIARVLDGGTTGSGRPYFVMELIEGVPITRYCDEKELAVRERVRLFARVCQAVHHAHQRGVIHRDLKPTNVLVTEQGGEPVPKVIDFGVAKATSVRLTEETLITGVGSVLGTLEYMSPEQAELNQRDVDTRSDIYSLGVLLYELLTGTTPIERWRLLDTALLEALRFVREEEPPRPSLRLEATGELPSIATRRGGLEPARLRVQLAGELDWIVMKALEKERDRRYGTASELALDIHRYLNDEPVSACPPSRHYRIRKFVRRHRPALVVAATFVLLLVVGIAVSLWQAVRATVAEREARVSGEQAMDALRILTDRVVERQLASRKRLTDEDRQFLETAVALFEGLAATRGDTRESRHIRAEGGFRVAAMRDSLGELEAARIAYEASIALYHELLAEIPGDAQYRHEAARVRFRLGSLLGRLGKTDEAEAEYRAVLAAQEELVAAFPEDAKKRRYLAGTHINLGNVQQTRGRHLAAEAQYDKALEILGAVAADFPEDPEPRLELALLRNNVGTLRASLGDRPGAREHFDAALPVLKQLVAEFPTRESYSLSLATLHHSLATVLNEEGQPEDAVREYRDALAILTRLAAEFPGDPAYRHKQAYTRMALGELLLRMEQGSEAEAELRQALAIQKQLAFESSVVLEYRRNLAKCHNALGQCFARRGRPVEAQAEFRQAVELGEALLGESPETPELHAELASGHRNLGTALERLGQRSEAEAEIRRALAIQEELRAGFPEVADFTFAVGETCFHLGDALDGAGKASEAIDAYDRGIATLAEMLSMDPARGGVRATLLQGHWARAGALGRGGRLAEALEGFDRALELDDGALRVELHLGRFSTMARSDPESAVAGLEEFFGQAERSGRWLPSCAHVYAIGSAAAPSEERREGLAARAVALLEISLQERGDLPWLRSSHEFDSLRSREDFQRLLARVAERGRGRATDR